MRKRHINEHLRTNFYPQGSRAAGMGILEDRYDEESGGPSYNPGICMFNIKTLEESGPIITYRLSEEELKKYKGDK